MSKKCHNQGLLLDPWTGVKVKSVVAKVSNKTISNRSFKNLCKALILKSNKYKQESSRQRPIKNSTTVRNHRKQRITLKISIRQWIKFVKILILNNQNALTNITVEWHIYWIVNRKQKAFIKNSHKEEDWTLTIVSSDAMIIWSIWIVRGKIALKSYRRNL